MGAAVAVEVAVGEGVSVGVDVAEEVSNGVTGAVSSTVNSGGGSVGAPWARTPGAKNPKHVKMTKISRNVSTITPCALV